MTSALIISGGSDYSDPWHPFAETSKRIAGVLEAAGCTTLIADRVADADFHDAQLLVVNAWNEDRASAGDAALRAGIESHIGAGRPLLSVHCSVMLFGAPPESAWDGWEAITGAFWERDVSLHPPFGDAVVRIATDGHPIVAGVRDFTVQDERYSFLRMRPDVEPLAWHEHEGVEHPLLWARTVRDARVVVDLLGHDARSYDSPARRELLARAIAWLLDDLD
ncbi:ThuA domain-containing protein [Lysobacter korlensis]|uniref:ThuA domain-containing protein n=1 Tax=Lysobacter korlensis TaxID=553636 RepID=A0ABV6RY60_9GAMM